MKNHLKECALRSGGHLLPANSTRSDNSGKGEKNLEMLLQTAKWLHFANNRQCLKRGGRYFLHPPLTGVCSPLPCALRPSSDFPTYVSCKFDIWKNHKQMVIKNGNVAEKPTKGFDDNEVCVHLLCVKFKNNILCFFLMEICEYPIMNSIAYFL